METTLRCVLLHTYAIVLLFALTGFSETTDAYSDSDEDRIVVSGTVVDAQTGLPLPGVNITVQGRVIGVATRGDGTFQLSFSGTPPVTLVVTLVGYQTREVEITETEVSDLVLELQEQAILGGDVVVSASRVEQSILEAPVTIEKMDIIAINQTASDTYYKALANLKGVDITTSSINFQIINSRGFNSTGNTRMVQLIDGMDTQAPALNFPIGNLNGPSELDIESVEFLPGASSALYGPNAFNGILLINSKSPFQYQGLSVMAKSGLNHFGGNQTLGEPENPKSMFDTSIRWADAPTDRFAYKVNFSYSRAEDWHGINYTDKNPGLQGNLSVNPAEDAIHKFGDDGSFNIGLLGFSSDFIQLFAAQTGLSQEQAQNYAMAIPSQPVNRTGYREKYLVDYGAENLKVNTSLHYRLTDNAELSYSFNYGSGTSIYTGAQRYSLKNFHIAQHKLELRGDNYMLRGYGTLENSGDSYIADFVGFAINDAYRPNNQWFGTYGGTFAGAFLQQVVQATGSSDYNEQVVNAMLNDPDVMSQIHMAARQNADEGRFEPGTPEFNAAKEATLQQRVPNGALFDDKSRFFHYEGQYDFKNEIDFVDLQAGATFRQFQLRSNGTIFDDEGGRNINEFGGYLQASRAIDRLRLTGSIRYDKNENFDGQFSPRISAVLGLGQGHNIRGSFQTGFRNPTTQGQYIDLNVINARLIGGLPFLAERYQITDNSYTMESVQNFTNQFLANPNEPAAAISHLRAYEVHNPVKPEQIQAYEIGYKGLLSDRLLVDAAYYYNIYDDFITQVIVRRAAASIFTQEGIGSLLSGDASNTFSVYTNIDETVRAQGAVFGLDYSLPNNYRIGFNYNWNSLIDGLDDEFLNDFNTPDHKFNVNFGNRRVTDNLGFNITFRWQDAFRWESSFAQVDVDAVSTLDAQVSYRLPDLKTVVKLGGTNILNQHHTLSGGGPNLGAIFYLSVTYDQLFR